MEVSLLSDEQLVLLTGTWAEILSDVPTADLLPALRVVMQEVTHARAITPVTLLQTWRKQQQKSDAQNATDYLNARRPGDDAEL